MSLAERLENHREDEMETKLVAEIIQRSQHSYGSSANMFGGPDCYVSLIIRPENSEPVGRHPLSRHNVKRFGWQEIVAGSGYSDHSGPRSSLGKAWAFAEAEAERLGAEIVERGVDY